MLNLTSYPEKCIYLEPLRTTEDEISTRTVAKLNEEKQKLKLLSVRESFFYTIQSIQIIDHK